MKKNRHHIKSDKRVALNFRQKLGHYSFVLVPLMIPTFELLFRLSGKTAVNTFSTRIQLLFILLSIIIGIFKWRELSYYEINEPRSDKEFEHAVLATANKLNWRIDVFNKNQVIATAYNPWKSRDAQTIIIERKPNKVLINSMMQLSFITVPDFLRVNKLNRNTFLNYYHHSNKIENLNDKVIQELKEQEDKLENEPEWNLKNTIKRIIAYIICLGFLGIALATWKYEGFNLAVVLFGIIGSSYILIDLYVMWTKSGNADSK